MLVKYAAVGSAIQRLVLNVDMERVVARRTVNSCSRASGRSTYA
jgi:hypothetical protein